MTVLVLSQARDLTADQVVLRLQARSVPVVRLDVGDFPAAITINAIADKEWSGFIDTSHHRLDLADVTAVYYRRPSPFRLDPAMSPPEANWAESEARHGFGGVLTTLDVHWINHPFHNAAATKPVQIAAAMASGLNVPRTLITNDPRGAQGFIAGTTTGTIYKTLSGSPSDILGHAIYTQALTSAEDLSGMHATAHLLQEYVPKAFEVRLTVVGPHMFPAQIIATSDAGTVDWRTDYDHLAYAVVELPKDIATGVQALMRRLSLRFGALDFVVDPNGNWWFLEINPNGQWGWIEDATGQPIADTIAADLQGENP